MTDKIWNSDIMYKIASFCVLKDLLHVEQVNKSWRCVVYQILLEITESRESFLRRYTYDRHIFDSKSCKNLELTNECCVIESCHGVVTQDSTNTPLNNDSNSFNTRCKSLENHDLPIQIGASAFATSKSGIRRLFGGWSNTLETCVSNVFSLDPRNYKQGWMENGNAFPTSHLCFAAASTLLDGRIVISGGSSTPFQGSKVSKLCYCGFIEDRVDISSSTIEWTLLPSFEIARCGHSLTTMFDGSLVACGGYSGGSIYLPSCERLDFGSGTWTRLPDMSFNRSGAGCVLGLDGCLYVAGGSPDGTASHRSLERLDLREGKWTILADMESGRGYTSACMGPGQGFYISGGLSDSLIINSMEFYDYRSNSWTGNVVPIHQDATSLDMEWNNHNGSNLCRAGHNMTYLWESL